MFQAILKTRRHSFGRRLRTCRIPDVWRNRATRRQGFTLSESLIAITVAATAGGALMMSMGSSVETTRYTLDKMIAAGLAEQVMDEVMGTRYAGVGDGATQWPLGASSDEIASGVRDGYDDTDDFADFTASPPEDPFGLAVGEGDPLGSARHSEFKIPSGYVSSWTQEIEVYYVDESDPTIRLDDGDTSSLRAVEVNIYEPTTSGSTRLLVSLRRVYAYVPSL